MKCIKCNAARIKNKKERSVDEYIQNLNSYCISKTIIRQN